MCKLWDKFLSRVLPMQAPFGIRPNLKPRKFRCLTASSYGLSVLTETTVTWLLPLVLGSHATSTITFTGGAHAVKRRSHERQK